MAKGIARLHRAWLLPVIVMLLALVAFMPMRSGLALAGLAERGLAARAAQGTVWSGRLWQLAAGPVPLGTVDARLEPLSLLVGRFQLHLSRVPGTGEPPLDARIGSGWGRSSLAGATGIVPLGGALAPLPVAALELTDVEAEFLGQRCVRAGGTVRMVLQPIAGLGAGQSGMTGTPRCARGALVLPLASQSGMEQLRITLYHDGRYEALLTAANLPPELIPALRDAGFTVAGSGVRLSTGGRL